MSRKVVKREDYVEQRFCDVCKDGTKAFYICCVCNKDLCTAHTIFDPDEYCEYPDRYCQSCWELGEPYRKELAKAKTEYEDLIKSINEEWRKQAKKGGEKEK